MRGKKGPGAGPMQAQTMLYRSLWCAMTATGYLCCKAGSARQPSYATSAMSRSSSATPPRRASMGGRAKVEGRPQAAFEGWAKGQVCARSVHPSPIFVDVDLDSSQVRVACHAGQHICYSAGIRAHARARPPPRSTWANRWETRASERSGLSTSRACASGAACLACWSSWERVRLSRGSGRVSMGSGRTIGLRQGLRWRRLQAVAGTAAGVAVAPGPPHALP